MKDFLTWSKDANKRLNNLRHDPTKYTPNWTTVTHFEEKIAAFFGAPFAVAVDSATHGIELCLRLTGAGYIACPTRTYLSVPMLANKLGIKLSWANREWTEYYCIWEDKNRVDIYDAAVLWRQDSYLKGSLMSISFQYQKHLSLGRGGMILCDNQEAAIQLKKMSYDGRLPGVPWREQNVNTIGYHYYMVPETAALGLQKLDAAIATEPRKWVTTDWPDVSEMDVFKAKEEPTKRDIGKEIMKELERIKADLDESVDQKIAALKAELTKEPVKSRSKN